MNKKEEKHPEILIKELQLFIDNTLIPGEIRPAIFWLNQRTTEELRRILFYKSDDQELEDDRVTLMKRILLFYYPECEALAIKRSKVSID